MEVWKIIIIAITVLWSFRLFRDTNKTFDETEVFLYFISVVMSIAFIAVKIDWSFITYKVF